MRDVVIPSITTAEVTSITDTSAISGGVVINAGSLPIIQKGVCWSTNQNPTLSDSYTSDGSGDGTFVSSIIGLSPSTTYYVRAYATYSTGIAYGNEESFITIAPGFVCGNTLSINHIAGEIAPINKTVAYGTVETDLTGSNKCWITQNLGSDRQALSATDASEESAGWYWQFNKKQGFKHDGITHIPNTTWILWISENNDWLPANDPCTVMLGSGWHLPTFTEWVIANATGGWDNSNEAFASVLKLHAAGYLINGGGSLYGRGSHGGYWSSSQSSVVLGYFLNFYDFSYIHDYSKAYGFSARCLLD
jgi:hypothetical protein